MLLAIAIVVSTLFISRTRKKKKNGAAAGIALDAESTTASRERATSSVPSPAPTAQSDGDSKASLPTANAPGDADDNDDNGDDATEVEDIDAAFKSMRQNSMFTYPTWLRDAEKTLKPKKNRKSGSGNDEDEEGLDRSYPTWLRQADKEVKSPGSAAPARRSMPALPLHTIQTAGASGAAYPPLQLQIPKAGDEGGGDGGGEGGGEGGGGGEGQAGGEQQQPPGAIVLGDDMPSPPQLSPRTNARTMASRGRAVSGVF